MLRGKPEIFDLITELLYEHITSKYCSLEEDTLPPVNFEHCVSINQDGAILEVHIDFHTNLSYLYVYFINNCFFRNLWAHFCIAFNSC